MPDDRGGEQPNGVRPCPHGAPIYACNDSDPTPPSDRDARERLIDGLQQNLIVDTYPSPAEERFAKIQANYVLDAILSHPKDIGTLLSPEQLRDLLEGAVEAGTIRSANLEIGRRVTDKGRDDGD